jgi:ribosome-associated toxin RatA of RatAB toxin-antitoxin module
MVGFINAFFTITLNYEYIQLQQLTIKHYPRFAPFCCTASVFSASLPSTVSDLVLIHESLTSDLRMNAK